MLTLPLFADFKKGLIAHYPFNGNANDESENGNDGIVYGATLTTDRFENRNKAYYFDGKDDYIKIETNSLFNSLGKMTNDYSISFWINKQSNSSSRIFEKWNEYTGTYPFSFCSGENISFGVYNGSYFGDSKHIKNNEWIHIVGVIKKNGNTVNLRFYINNILSVDKNIPRSSYSNNEDIYIGRAPNRSDRYFKGIVDDIYIFNRELLSSEISALYSTGSKYKQKFPPDLYIENLKFFEPSHNNALDALEKGSIQFDIVNKGRGNANDIEVDISPLTSSQNLSFNTKTKIEEIKKKDRKEISIPISADIDVTDLFREFRIEITESNGFDADPAKISFETFAFAAPDLKIEQIAIDDNEDSEGEGFSYGNGNSIIEPNESIEVTAYVQNFGEGVAKNVKAEVILSKTNRDITYPDEGKILNLGDIESGDFRKVEFYFYTSRRYDEKNIPISIKLSENTGKFSKSVDLGLKLGDRTKNIVDVHIAKIHKDKNPIMKELDNIIVLSDVDKDIPKTNIDGKNTLAIIVGIEDYKYAPSVEFASNDARIFYQYAKSVFGIPERNIYYRINDGATSGEFNKIFADDGWISRRLKKEQTDVIVYYSGHGAPDSKSEKGFLIPYDIDPNYANTGVSLDKIYSSLSKLKAKSVTLFIDACFSGESRSQEMLIAGIRPISVKIKNPILTSENMAVFSASTGEQYSSAYPEKQHGLFTYFLLKGLKGCAKGSDKEITLYELQNYIYNNVSQTAGYLDREQNPTFIGKNKSRVLLKY
jgi:hypothetical protein